MRQWIGSALAQIMACRLFVAYCINNCWVIANRTLRNKVQWSLNQNAKLFIHGNAYENIVCEMAAILSRRRWVKVRYSLKVSDTDITKTHNNDNGQNVCHSASHIGVIVTDIIPIMSLLRMPILQNLTVLCAVRIRWEKQARHGQFEDKRVHQLSIWKKYRLSPCINSPRKHTTHYEKPTRQNTHGHKSHTAPCSYIKETDKTNKFGKWLFTYIVIYSIIWNFALFLDSSLFVCL